MNTPAPHIEALERALGRVIADSRAEASRQAELVAARADAELAKLELRAVEMDARLAGLDAEIDRRVAAGIEAGLGAIEARLSETLRPDDAPLVAMGERLAAVEARSTDALAERVAAVEARGAAIAEWQVGFTPPDVPDLEPLVARVAALEDAPPPAPDLSGLVTREELAEAVAAIPEPPAPKDWSEEIGEAVASVTSVAEALREDSERLAENVRERLARHPGNLPTIKAWSDGVVYAGDIVTHDGATWQARRDTGKPPPHEDWSCIAAKGDKGEPGRSIEHRGTYAADGEYRARDEVALDGSTFRALTDDPGPCPGEGWQLIAIRGGRGKPGADGSKGATGKAGEPLVAADVSGEGLLTLTNGDGSTVQVDLYPVLAKVR